MIELDIKQIQNLEYKMLKEVVNVLQSHNILYYMSYGSVLGTIRHNGPIPWDFDVDIMIPINSLNKALEFLKNELSSNFIIREFDDNYKYIFPRICLNNSLFQYICIDIFPVIGLPNDKNEQIKMCKKMNSITKILTNKNLSKFIVRKTKLKMLIAHLIEFIYISFSNNKLYEKYYKIAYKYSYDTSTNVFIIGGCYKEKDILNKEVLGVPNYKKYNEIQVPIPQQWDNYLKHYYGEYMKYPSQNEIDERLNFKLKINECDYKSISNLIDKNA